MPKTTPERKCQGSTDPIGHTDRPVGLFTPELVMANQPKTTPRGRDADSGQFRTVEWAKRHPREGIVERVPTPGNGDTKPSTKPSK